MERARLKRVSIPKITVSAQFGLKFEPAREHFFVSSFRQWYAKLKRAVMLVHQPIDYCSGIIDIGALAIYSRMSKALIL